MSTIPKDDYSISLIADQNQTALPTSAPGYVPASTNCQMDEETQTIHPEGVGLEKLPQIRIRRCSSSSPMELRNVQLEEPTITTVSGRTKRVSPKVRFRPRKSLSYTSLGSVNTRDRLLLSQDCSTNKNDDNGFLYLRSATPVRLAGPALTRTNVHAISITPSRGSEEVQVGRVSDPYMSTTQIVESKNGCYEVDWRDPRASSADELLRPNSYAGISHPTDNSMTKRYWKGAEYQYLDWPPGLSSPVEPRLSIIDGLPSQRKQTLHFDCAVDDNEDLVILAPPNSERTSVGSSRCHSQCIEPCVTRLSSYKATEPHWSSDTSSALVDERSKQSTSPAAFYGTWEPRLRQLSNIEESEMHFRTHKDSLALTRARFQNASYPAHHNFLARSKRRMLERAIATSSESEFQSSQDSSSNFLVLAEVPLEPDLSASLAQEQPTHAVNTRSMFVPQSPSSHQHIRIVE